ncbi:putative isomerase, 3-hydroxyacyl-CoA dehydrogenase, Enoyl-CoA hydratase [Helianthus annuus]|uniref:Isomerase, 3-hydroxyacyl-CoA dehydrogenase, Enoyl-CoA hydratase n=2 Tax=Helianthus annuus TaxID=4232 RepID=A0A9K3HRP1_HELAN|nr:putative isomerase, 3-hydroxyacyl-CoA dehydrogenase, Enoyl-CoA hydratase [Helianthus annuus]
MRRDDVKAIVLTGKNGRFSGGFDINVFQKVHETSQLPDVSVELVKWETNSYSLVVTQRRPLIMLQRVSLILSHKRLGFWKPHEKNLVAFGGQSVTLVGSKLIMFGGEAKHRLLLNDFNVLDLEIMLWNVAETT